MEDSSERKKILIDTTFLFDQYARRGIGRYGRNVIRRMILDILEKDDFEINLVGFLSLGQNLVVLEFSEFQIEEIKNKINFYTLGEPSQSTIKNAVSWPLDFVPIINKCKPDIYFAPHLERGLPSTDLINRNLEHKPKTIVMAHDAIPLVINKFSSKGPIQNKIKEKFFKLMWSGLVKADVVVTNSNFSKKDLVKYGEISEEKVKVIYLGVDQNFFDGRTIFNKDIIDQTLNTYGLQSKEYFFYDSGIEPNKSPLELLQVFDAILSLKDKDLPLKLVLTGGDFHRGIGEEIKPKTILGEDFLRIAKRLGVSENIVATDKLSDEHLTELLLESYAYLNLSSYEGFSFGPVQAMAARIPTIAANSSCTPEITDGGALLVNLDVVRTAEGPATVAKEIQKFLKDKKTMAEHLRKAQEIARRYQWDKTADETMVEVRKLVNS
jgi:glycosyltransferase involved in cell wall biosynthesis